MADDRLASQVEARIRELSLDDLKTVLHTAQKELSRRRDIGDRKMVDRVLQLATDNGWRRESGADAVQYLMQCINKENM